MQLCTHFHFDQSQEVIYKSIYLPHILKIKVTIDKKHNTYILKIVLCTTIESLPYESLDAEFSDQHVRQLIIRNSRDQVGSTERTQLISHHGQSISPHKGTLPVVHIVRSLSFTDPLDGIIDANPRHCHNLS